MQGTQFPRRRMAQRHRSGSHPHHLVWASLAVFLTLLLAACSAGAATAVYFARQLPSTSGFRMRYAFQDARIFDSQGDLLYTMSDLGENGGRRVVEQLQARYATGSACRGGINRIPAMLQNATIATEDATFYRNSGSTR